MLRKNKETGGFERLVDGNWVPAPDVEDAGDLAEPEGSQGKRPSAVGVAEESQDHDRVDWNSVEKLFADDAAQGGTEAGDAPGSDAPGSAAGGDLAGAVRDSDARDSALVQVPEGPGPEGSGQLATLEPQSQPSDGTEKADGEDALLDEIPGLTTADKKTGVQGQRGVLQKLRDRRRVSRNTSARDAAPKPTDGSVIKKSSGRGVQRVEVSETNARPRGPAVRDSTESRQKAREQAKTSRSEPGRISTKPSPEIVSGQARWIRDLFEAHFRSSRTLELRHMPLGKNGKNRMKMSRADFAIGWLVLLEAARRDPSILHLKELSNAEN